MWLIRVGQEHAESMFNVWHWSCCTIPESNITNASHIRTNTYTYIYISYTIDFPVALNICNFQDLEANIIVVLWYTCMWRQSVWMPSKRWGKNSSNKRDKCFALSSGQLLCSAKLHGSPAQRSVDQWKNLVLGNDWYVVMVWMVMNTPATWIYLNILKCTMVEGYSRKVCLEVKFQCRKPYKMDQNGQPGCH